MFAPRVVNPPSLGRFGSPVDRGGTSTRAGIPMLGGVLPIRLQDCDMVPESTLSGGPYSQDRSSTKEHSHSQQRQQRQHLNLVVCKVTRTVGSGSIYILPDQTIEILLGREYRFGQ